MPSNTTIANQTITLTKATSGSVTVPNIPVGDTCTVTEKTPPDAPIDYLWGALPAPVVTGPMAEGGTLKAAVLNTLHLGSNGGGEAEAKPKAKAKAGEPSSASANKVPDYTPRKNKGR